MPRSTWKVLADEGRPPLNLRKDRAMNRKSMLAIGIVSVSLVALIGTPMSAQDKYSLKTSSGVALSDFRGSEDWQVGSSTRTDNLPQEAPQAFAQAVIDVDRF